MGIFDKLKEFLGGQANTGSQRLASGQADLRNLGSPDVQQLQQLFGQASPQHLQQSFTDAARQTGPQPGGASLAGLEHGALATIASTLLSQFASGGMDISTLLGAVPGLYNTQPEQMTAPEVSGLAGYIRQNHPDVFGRAAAEIAKQNPSLLQSLLGSQMLHTAVSKLASQWGQGPPAAG